MTKISTDFLLNVQFLEFAISKSSLHPFQTISGKREEGKISLHNLPLLPPLKKQKYNAYYRDFNKNRYLHCIGTYLSEMPKDMSSFEKKTYDCQIKHMTHKVNSRNHLRYHLKYILSITSRLMSAYLISFSLYRQQAKYISY